MPNAAGREIPFPYMEDYRRALIRKYHFLWFQVEPVLEQLKSRLKRLSADPRIEVLRNLLGAEVANIKAKYYYEESSLYYTWKRNYLRKAIAALPGTGWKFCHSLTYPGRALNYIFYVELPGSRQVSWHGLRVDIEMKGVPLDQSIEWDGEEGVTLEKIVDYIMELCPGILDDRYTRKVA